MVSPPPTPHRVKNDQYNKDGSEPLPFDEPELRFIEKSTNVKLELGMAHRATAIAWEQLWLLYRSKAETKDKKGVRRNFGTGRRLNIQVNNAQLAIAADDP